MRKVIHIFAILLISFSCRKSDYYIEIESVITDLGGGTGTVTWTKEKSYIIDGFVFVNDGQILTIEKGTVIRAKTGQASLASALIVARGGKIIAQGTQEEPIVFTVEGDDLQGSVSIDASGLWGGLIILGNAPINAEYGEGFIEGIPISEPRGIYGGEFPEDNSGILEYVSIIHGGTNIGEGNEINGLTLGGVGRKTIIDHVEVISNADDGIEFFGGTVNCSNLAVAFCDDDLFDFDEGYTGKCQFLLGIMHDTKGDHMAEHSGNSDGYLSSDYTVPVIYNSTFIGHSEGENYMMSFDFISGGVYRNSIFLSNAQGIAIEYTPEFNSFLQIENNQLAFENNIFYNIASNYEDSIFVLHPDNGSSENEQNFLSSYFSEAQNIIEDPGFEYVHTPIKLLPSSTEFENLAAYSSDWFEKVSYKGAFGSNNWLEGWSILWKEGIVE
ncbi:MAG: hypothetical protein K9H49_16000 [Bacteroidales bacterium]|nr:hypothetical protein [Bacteroidales bacterium]MCF8390380.1 hypothetical protein [Bacteroidales bacterium]